MGLEHRVYREHQPGAATYLSVFGELRIQRRSFRELAVRNGPTVIAPFACKGRGICPSCMGRRMCQTAANLVEHVLPPVPLRQWVFTMPHQLRGRLAFDGKLLGAVTRLFVDSILGWYHRRLRASTRERA